MVIDDAPSNSARWRARVHYRAYGGSVDVEFLLTDVFDLYTRVELGPHWDTIELIELARVNKQPTTLVPLPLFAVAAVKDARHPRPIVMDESQTYDLNGDAPRDMVRWNVSACYYSTDAGVVDAEMLVREISDLHDLIEIGPLGDSVDLIKIVRINHAYSPTLTLEQAAAL